ncbi:site-specific DNA-methyltransferase [Actinomadura darangshiensis]|uniref:Methyltransferase n=1 Tax=Actinomadura darangshiensis TaxID=705336 RepID=A0A4R5A2H9_9ACTN|nr:DNA methyltransferase [Actinomadura darangshiensis]TDD63682.1 site-specific DNA-methyltransferase [Actinomadura darangshiensis]
MNTSSHPETRELASVLVTGQQPSRIQRKGRYTPESMTHPAKMLPAIAAQVIATYTEPGDLVIDPMCGIGTTLVEAVHQGRDATGMEYEAHFAQMAAGNLRNARAQGATGTGQVVHGDARNITTALADLTGTAALVVTSPPYGASTHGQVVTSRDNGGGKIDKSHSRYSTDRRNLAHRPTAELVTGFGEILAGCAVLLRPGGVIAVTVRPFRVAGELVDLPGQVITTAEDNGLALADRFAALLCGLRDGQFVTRASFFQMIEARRLREHGIPAMATAHEDLLVFKARPRTATSPNEVAGLDLHGEGVPSYPNRPTADPAVTVTRWRRRR